MPNAHVAFMRVHFSISAMPTIRQGGALRPSCASPGPGGCEKMRFLWQQLVSSVPGISEARSQGLASQTATMS